MIPVDPRWGTVALAAWLLTYAVHSTLLLGTVGVLSRLKTLPANLEQTLWKTALLGSLITATVMTLGLSGGSLGLRIHLAPTSAPVTRILPHDQSLMPGTDTPDAELPARRTWVVLAAWAITGALGLFRLSRAKQHLEGELGERRALAFGPHWEVLETLRRSVGLDRRVRLTVSPQLGSPIAIGHEEICFPERALTELKPEEMRSALAHELAHLAHRDPAWKSFAAGLNAVFFFQPLLRLARRRLDETAEYLADDWAVRHSGNEVSLARCLATVAGWQTTRLQTVGASQMAGGTSPLFRRVERLLGVRPSEPARIWCHAGAALLVLGGWILAPGVTTRPRQVEPLVATMRSEPLVPMTEITLLPEVLIPQAPPTPVAEPPARIHRRAPRAHRHAPEMAQQTPLPDRDTAPVARVIIIPHEIMHARLEILRSLPEVQNLDPEVMRALIGMQQRLFEMEMAARGIRVVWMEPPAPPAPPAHSDSQI